LPNEDLLKILFGTKIELKKTLNLTQDEIQKEALEYFKKNKHRIFETFIENKIDTKRICFTAGASGANADLFQNASIKTVEYLLDNYFKHNYSFILDTNLASFEGANKNIQRALRGEYQIEIFFIYRNYDDRKQLTNIRETNENQKVPDSVFNQKAIGSLETFKKLVEEYSPFSNLYLIVVDLDRDEVLSSDTPTQLHERLAFYSQELEKYLDKNRES